VKKGTSKENFKTEGQNRFVVFHKNTDLKIKKIEEIYYYANKLTQWAENIFLTLLAMFSEHF